MKKTKLWIFFSLALSLSIVGTVFYKLAERRSCYQLLRANLESLRPTLNNTVALRAIAHELKYPYVSDLAFGALSEYQQFLSKAFKEDFRGTKPREVEDKINRLLTTGSEIASDLEDWSQKSNSKDLIKLKTLLQVWKDDIENFQAKKTNLGNCF